MNQQILVTKRNGDTVPLDIEKLHRVVQWACEGITGVSASEVEIKSHIQFYNKIKTSDIQETLIKSAADLITEETPNYQYVGGRLITYHLRKEVYGQFQPWHIKDLVKKNIERGFYDEAIIELFDDEEWDKINSFIKHERDEDLTYVAMEQMRGKYLTKNRVTGEIYETPQIAYALISVILFAHYPKEVKLQWAKQYYDAISTHEISLPTPITGGVRSGRRQFSSCVLIESDDSLNSINATASSIVQYVSQRAGIGIGGGKLRAQGSPIRNGDAYHTGLIPFYKYWEKAVNSCSQGGIRKGCVQRDSYVEKVTGIEFNGKQYFWNEILEKDGKVINISEIIKAVAYMANEDERNAYLQNMFSGNFTIKTSSNNET